MMPYIIMGVALAGMGIVYLLSRHWDRKDNEKNAR